MKLKETVVIIFLLFVSEAFSQNYWKAISHTVEKRNLQNNAFQLDKSSFKDQLPSDFNTEGKVYFPDSQGKSEYYSVWQTKTLSDELQKKYPNIRTYTGISIDNPKKKINFVWTAQGLSNVSIIDGDKIAYIKKGNNENYFIKKSILSKEKLKISECQELHLDDVPVHSAAVKAVAKENENEDLFHPAENPVKTRVIRFAVLATVEYSRAVLYYSQGYGGPTGSPYEHATNEEKKKLFWEP